MGPPWFEMTGKDMGDYEGHVRKRLSYNCRDSGSIHPSKRTRLGEARLVKGLAVH